jgi:AAA family ATPase
MKLTYVPSELGEPASSILLHPSDMRGLLPGEMLTLCAPGAAPLYVAPAWPCKRVAAGSARLPCLSIVMEALRRWHSPSAAALVACSMLRGAPPPPAAAALHVLRPAGSAPGARGGPSLRALQPLLVGLALPLEGLVVDFPSGADAALVTAVRLLPVLPTSGGARVALVGAGTCFLEGPPSASPRTAGAELRPSRPPLPPLGGLQGRLAELAALAGAALAAPPAGAGLLRAPRGALLTGAPGTGKTLLAQWVAAELQRSLVTVRGPELMSEVVGATEARLRGAWARASAAGGGLLLIDGVDALAPARDSEQCGEVECRVVAQLLALMDGVEVAAEPAAAAAEQRAAQRVFVLATTSRPATLDPALRRPGRFDVEVALAPPSAAARVDVLRACLAPYPHALTAAEVAAAAEGMHGFVGADVALACREAAWAAARQAAAAVAGGGGDAAGEDAADAAARSLSRLTLGPPPPAGGGTCFSIALADLLRAAGGVVPSALRDTAVEVARTPWSAISGQNAVKAALREAIEWPRIHRAAFRALGISPPRGVLLFGPPGCSKTMMARAMATSGAMSFVSVKGPELFSKYVGDSEKAVAAVFARARAAAPCVLFFDEFDALGGARDGDDGGGEGGGVGVRVVAQLLQEMDACGGEPLEEEEEEEGAGLTVVVVAATNRPDLIDPALLRPGRIDTHLYVGLPDANARADLARAQLAGVAAAEDVTPERVAQATDGASGAEVCSVIRDACSRALVEGASDGPAPQLRWDHVKAAAAACTRQCDAAMLAFYEKWRSKTK